MRRGLAVLLLVLAACRSEPREDPVEVVRAAVERTLAKGSATVSGTATLGDATLLVEGATSFATGEAEVRLSLSTDALPGRPQRYETRTVGDGYYLRGGGNWLVVERARARVRARPFAALGRVDAGETLRFLAGVTEARRGGSDDVRGTATRRYTGTLDLTRVPGTEEAVFRLGRPDAAFTAWLDGDGAVRRLTLDVDADRLIGSDLRGTLSVTYDLVAFGVPVDVTAPQGATPQSHLFL